jgi:hypothetical protein
MQMVKNKCQDKCHYNDFKHEPDSDQYQSQGYNRDDTPLGVYRHAHYTKGIVDFFAILFEVIADVVLPAQFSTLPLF